MKVTVCELNNDFEGLQRDWSRLAAHVRAEESELVLLPEMPFHPWLAASSQPVPGMWEEAVKVHDRWLERLKELTPAAIVTASRPVMRRGKKINEAFLWERSNGVQAAHEKYYLPDEDGFWEATWYERGEKAFDAVSAGDVKVGFMICTELWFLQHARSYGQQGADLILCPRAVNAGVDEKWLNGGRTAAVVSGAYCLSSNLSGTVNGVKMGGTGWVIEPDQGKVLAVTSPEQPFVTVSLDLGVARAAKNSYPRYVKD